MKRPSSGGSRGEERPGSPAIGAAQRLWLLERGPMASSVMPEPTFAGAVAVLAGDRVYLLVVISDMPDRASERWVYTPGRRLRLERDAFRCETMDDALAMAGRIRDEFVSRGWYESTRAV